MEVMEAKLLEEVKLLLMEMIGAIIWWRCVGIEAIRSDGGEVVDGMEVMEAKLLIIEVMEAKLLIEKVKLLLMEMVEAIIWWRRNYCWNKGNGGDGGEIVNREGEIIVDGDDGGNYLMETELLLEWSNGGEVCC